MKPSRAAGATELPQQATVTKSILFPMTAEEIQAVQQAAVTPAQRLAIALAAVHAARPAAIRGLTLDDIDLPNVLRTAPVKPAMKQRREHSCR